MKFIVVVDPSAVILIKVSEYFPLFNSFETRSPSKGELTIRATVLTGFDPKSSDEISVKMLGQVGQGISYIFAFPFSA